MLTRTHFYSPSSGANQTVKKSIPLAIVLIMATLLLSGVLPQPASASPDWWDPAWSCRKAITVTELSGSALTDYQVKIDLSYEPSMLADFGDLRFINAADNLLKYWIESKTDETSATVWVEVDDIEASADTTIYMYYGNPAASSASDGTSTFIFFDDFSGDLGQWETQSASGVYPKIESGYLRCGGGTTGSPYGWTCLGSEPTYTDFQDNAVEFRYRVASKAICEVSFRGDYDSNTGYKGRSDQRSGEGQSFLKPPYQVGAWGFITSRDGDLPSVDVWYRGTITASGSIFNLYRDGILKRTATDSQYTGPGQISLQNHHGSYTDYDWVAVRNFTAPEPTCSVGLEECNSAPSPPADLGPAAYTDGGWVDNNTPTLEFTQSDPEGNTVSYTIQIDDNDDFSPPAVDYTSGLLTQGAASFTSPSLPDGDYYWRVMSTDQHGFEGGWTEANGGDVAFRLNTATEAGRTSKDRYRANQDVEVFGSGFPPYSDIDVYVVEEGEWLGGETIADYGIMVMKTFTTGDEGEIGGVIWEAPLEIGEYDLVFDADRNGIYDEIPDFVDHPNHPGFTVVEAAVGGTVYPADKAALLLPWLVLSAGLILATGGLILIRRQTWQSDGNR
jgi:hypothetical protein